LNYDLLAVARQSQSKRAPFPINNPPTPTTLEVATLLCLRKASRGSKFKVDIFRVRVWVDKIWSRNLQILLQIWT